MHRRYDGVMEGFITEAQLDEAEHEFPGIVGVYVAAPTKPRTFLDLLAGYLCAPAAATAPSTPGWSSTQLLRWQRSDCRGGGRLAAERGGTRFATAAGMHWSIGKATPRRGDGDRVSS